MKWKSKGCKCSDLTDLDSILLLLLEITCIDTTLHIFHDDGTTSTIDENTVNVQQTLAQLSFPINHKRKWHTHISTPETYPRRLDSNWPTSQQYLHLLHRPHHQQHSSLLAQLDSEHSRPFSRQDEDELRELKQAIYRHFRDLSHTSPLVVGRRRRLIHRRM